MTTIVAELYEALKKAGVDEDTARKAAQAVIGAEEKAELVTKDFLRAEINALKAYDTELRQGIDAVLADLSAEVEDLRRRRSKPC